MSPDRISDRTGVLVSVAHLQRLGGVFEIGGNVGLHKTTHLYPKMVVEDKSFTQIETLRRDFGGRITPHRRCYRWQSIGNGTADLISGLSEYAPSRRGVGNLMRSWHQLSFEDKWRLFYCADLFQRSEVQIDDYQDLVEIPAFVTGVLQLRGPRRYRFSVEQARWMLKDILLTSTNLVLLQAMRNRFGGDVRTSQLARSPKSHDWYIGYAEAREMLGFISDFENSL